MTQINPNQLKQFILKAVGTSLDKNEAKKKKKEKEYNAIADEQDVNNIEIDDIIEDTDLYEQFATLYVTEQDKKAEAKDKEQEEKEQTKVKDKNKSGV